MGGRIAKLWPLAEKCLDLGTLAENLPGAFLVYKASGEEEILFASEGLVDIFECDSMEDFIKFTGGSFATLVYPEDVEQVDETIWRQVRASGGFDYVQYRVITKGGKIKHIEDWGRLVHNEALGGDVFFVFLHDMRTRDALIAAGKRAD